MNVQNPCSARDDVAYELIKRRLSWSGWKPYTILVSSQDSSADPDAFTTGDYLEIGSSSAACLA
jgi:hypothetical protein